MREFKNRNSVQSENFSPIYHQKKVFRTFYKKKVQKLDADSKKEKEKQIIKNLQSLNFTSFASYIAAYQALPDEPNLLSFYKRHSNNTRFCFPVIKESNLEFYTIENQLKKNKFSILEPEPIKKNQIMLDEISIFFLPGLAFDRKGIRLGRGKGFYDKTLKKRLGNNRNKAFYQNFTTDKTFFEKAKKTQALILGVSFCEQVCNEDLPFEEHDISVDILVTDKYVLTPLDIKELTNNSADKVHNIKQER